jgi:hypothetical protein
VTGPLTPASAVASSAVAVRAEALDPEVTTTVRCVRYSAQSHLHAASIVAVACSCGQRDSAPGAHRRHLDTAARSRSRRCSGPAAWCTAGGLQHKRDDNCSGEGMTHVRHDLKPMVSLVMTPDGALSEASDEMLSLIRWSALRSALGRRSHEVGHGETGGQLSKIQLWTLMPAPDPLRLP